MKRNPSSVSSSTISSQKQKIHQLFNQYKLVNPIIKKMQEGQARSTSGYYHHSLVNRNQKQLNSPRDKAPQTNVAHNVNQTYQQIYSTIKIHPQSYMRTREYPNAENIGFSNQQTKKTSLNYSQSFSLNLTSEKNYSEGAFNTPQKQYNFEKTPNLQYQSNNEFNHGLSSSRHITNSQAKRLEKQKNETEKICLLERKIEEILNFCQQLSFEVKKNKEEEVYYRNKFVDSLKDLSQSLALVLEKVNRMEEKMNRMEEKVDRMEEKVNRMEEKVNRMEEKMDRIENDGRGKFSFRHNAQL